MLTRDRGGASQARSTVLGSTPGKFHHSMRI